MIMLVLAFAFGPGSFWSWRLQDFVPC